MTLQLKHISILTPILVRGLQLVGFVLIELMKANLNLQSRAEKAKEKVEFASYIGKRLREVRESAGFSQEQLSEKAGYYRTYVGHIENGKHSPSLHTMWRLASAMDKSLEEVVKKI
jgi:putative transcriptional regulator